MAKIKVICYYITELIMAICLLVLIGIVLLKTTIYNKDYILKLFDDNNYYEKLNENIKNEMSNNLIPTQLPDTVLDNIYTTDDIKKEINKMIDSLYTNESTEVETTKISENLNNNINKMTDIYKNKISQSNIYSQIKKIISKTNKYINTGLIILIIILPVLFIISLLLKKDYNISLCFLTTSILDIALTFYIKSNLNIDKISIWDESISNMIRTTINKIINTSNTIVICLIIISIILILIKKDKSNNKKKSKK